MEVEVVTRQVGEAADREFDAVDASEAQRVAGHLHHHGVDVLFEHQRQQRLKIGRLGCGQLARQVLTRDPDADRADQTSDPSSRPQPRLDQIGGGGLARRAGHPDHPQVPRRVAVHGGGQPAEHRSRVGTDQHRHRRIATHVGKAVRVGEHSDRAAPDGVSRVASAVRRRAGQRREQIPRLGVLAAQSDAGDDGFPRLVDRLDDRANPVGQMARAPGRRDARDAASWR